jgi:hypothetical protein
MSELVERVAKAIDPWPFDPDYNASEDFRRYRQKVAREKATAAIAAMPSPSEDVARLEAEVAVLKKERDTWDRRVLYDELKAREYENLATAQSIINGLIARALSAESDAARLREALEAEREACAKIVEGRVYKTRYREWPEWGAGNRSADDEAVKLTAALAAAIRARAALIGTGDGWRDREETRLTVLGLIAGRDLRNIERAHAAAEAVADALCTNGKQERAE